MLTAEELHKRGKAALVNGRVAQARTLLERAHRLAEQPDLVALIDISMSYAVAESGQQSQAESLCRAVIRRSHLSDSTRALGWSQLGLLLMRAGELAEAAKCLRKALPKLAEDFDIATAHLNLGNLALQRGDLSAAREHFELAQRAFEDAQSPLSAAKSGHNLAYVDLLLGDIPLALKGMEAHSSAFAANSPVLAAVAAQDRAEALMAAGLIDDADEALDQSARAFGARRLSQFQGETELLRARGLLLKDPALARKVARAAARRFRVRGATSWVVRAEAVDVMAQVALGGSSVRLLATAEGLVSRLRGHHLAAEAAEVGLFVCKILLNRGQVAMAQTRLRRRLPESASLQTVMLRLELKAQADAHLGKTQAALSHVREGLAMLHDWQSSFGSLDLQSSLVLHGRGLADLGMRLAISSGSMELCFEWSERARTLVNRVRPVRPPADPVVAAELAELRFLTISSPVPRSEAGQRLRELRASVREHSWFGAGSGEVTEPASLAVLQEALGVDEAAFVAYIGIQGRIYAQVVTAHEAELLDVGAFEELDRQLDDLHADLDMAATDLPDSLRSVVEASATTALAQLGNTLVTPVLDRIGDRRLVITPSSVLARTPWTLLPGFEGRPIAVPQSATRWLATRGQVRDRSRVVGFVAGPGVERANHELRSSQQAWGSGELLLDSTATVQAATALAQRTDVIHFAAHGRHAPDNPLFSGLELADGTFFGYDIDQIQRVPKVVLLSACEVGRASVRSGEETVGMTAAWLHAGAESVISSCALIGDQAAEDVLTRVHALLATGVGPAEALAAAQAASDSLAPLICFGAGW